MLLLENNIKNRVTGLAAVMFWGSVWGIAEATIGFVMHAAHLRGVGFFLFPVALLAMCMAVKSTGRARAAVAVAVVAALIKLCDLFVLGPWPAYYVVNPAVHIALQGLAVGAFLAVVRRERSGMAATTAIAALAMVMLYVAFWGWRYATSVMWTANPAATSFGGYELQFVAQTAMLVAAVWLMRHARVRQVRISPAWAWAMAVCAIVVNILTF